MLRLSAKNTDPLTQPSLPGGADTNLWSPAPDSLGRLRCALLLLWACTSFGLMYFAQSLQRWVGDLPLSHWLAAQGIILMFVLIVFVYAVLANRAERVQIAGNEAVNSDE